MEFKAVKIRGTHPYSFRSGEWADLSGVKMSSFEGSDRRLCYEAIYDDGVKDYIAVIDFGNYEIK